MLAAEPDGSIRRRPSSPERCQQRQQLTPAAVRQMVMRGDRGSGGRRPPPPRMGCPKAAAALVETPPGAVRAQPGTDANGVPRQRGATRNGRLHVAVDVDEVLGRFLHALNRFCKARYSMEFDIHDYNVYEFAKIWNCSQDMSNHIVHEFFKSSEFRCGIPVMPGAQETLLDLSSWCDLTVVTSRQHVIREPTLEWIREHFPGVFQNIHFGNHFAMEGKSKRKSEICRDIEADVLVDDNPKYAIECAQEGVHVVLYDWHETYPWSKLPDGTCHPRIWIVKDWDGVKDALMTIKLGNYSDMGKKM